jgi:hypothetical protein
VIEGHLNREKAASGRSISGSEQIYEFKFGVIVDPEGVVANVVLARAARAQRQLDRSTVCRQAPTPPRPSLLGQHGGEVEPRRVTISSALRHLCDHQKG